MIGQTARLAPADRRIYALRDVTGDGRVHPAHRRQHPVEEARRGHRRPGARREGRARRVHEGRRCGAGRSRAPWCAWGRRAGKQVVALLTDMNAPIGNTVGNALETREAIEVLIGEGPARHAGDHARARGVEMLLLGKVAKKPADARKKLEAAIADGSGLEVLARMVEAQGGDPRAVHDPARLPRAKRRAPVPAPSSGFVVDLDALALGLCGVAMGAGRTRADQKVDPAVGIELAAKPGDRVAKGEPLAWLHLQSKAKESELAERVQRAYRIGTRAPAPRELVLDRISK